MAHFSATDNLWLADGVAASLASKNQPGPYFWPHTNQWVSGQNTQPTLTAAVPGKPYFCPRLNQWTTGTC